MKALFKAFACSMAIFMGVYLVIGHTATGSPEKVRTITPVTFILDEDGSVEQPNDWQSGSSAPCEEGENLCAIMFNTEDYELDDQGKPNAQLLEFIENNWESAVHGGKIPGTEITVYLRL